MNLAVKIILYVALTILAIWLGLGFARAYRNMAVEPTRAPAPVATNLTPSGIEGLPPAAASNALIAATNVGLSVTNQVTETNTPASLISTNAVVETNAVAALRTNSPLPESTPQTNTVLADDDGTSQISSRGPQRLRGKDYGVLIRYLVGLVAALVGLGLLLAKDFSRTVGSKAVEFLFNDDAIGVRRPEYDAAEHMWATGDYLEAIRMMREYYTANPREVFVAIRIAEIYEKDLKNLLASALEYEEILTKSLPPANWSWTSIHLCNIYSKMGQSDKSLALLRRIAVEYGETPGAEKARKRLNQIDPTFLATMTITTLASEAEDRALKKPSKPGKDDSASQNLPSGFRPRK